MLPLLTYCTHDWMSAAASHLLLLNRLASMATRLSVGLVVCDLGHKHCVAAL